MYQRDKTMLQSNLKNAVDHEKLHSFIDTFLKNATWLCDAQQNFAHLPMLTGLMTAFEENNALENLLADITSDGDDDDVMEYSSSQNVEATSSDEDPRRSPRAIVSKDGFYTANTVYRNMSDSEELSDFNEEVEEKLLRNFEEEGKMILHNILPKKSSERYEVVYTFSRLVSKESDSFYERKCSISIFQRSIQEYQAINHMVLMIILIFMVCGATRCCEPTDMESNRLFVCYAKGKCSNQVIGKHKIAEVPKTVASYLNLADPELYTGHSLRRTSAILLSASGADLVRVKNLGAWKSDAVAQRYIDHSELTKKQNFDGIISVVNSKSTVTSFNKNASVDASSSLVNTCPRLLGSLSRAVDTRLTNKVPFQSVENVVTEVNSEKNVYNKSLPQELSN
ncbi:hypothetical protein TSAR_005488 [Trichomalopsis sarcophagae]|uniref:Tyr recombinase domain-containing protein n=1 Tax=Trichomalopsis sarcophagae TaxID=543379 RepID=A0A232EQP8_9HYME|nr:hypothetical protein TSAR_005488 [Trichomalopsis sarcophagae]